MADNGQIIQTTWWRKKSAWIAVILVLVLIAGYFLAKTTIAYYYFWRGEQYWADKSYELAADNYSKSINWAPNFSFKARYFLASYYFEQTDKPEKALEVLLPALDSRNPVKTEIYKVNALLSGIYIYFEKYSLAEKHAKLALETAPQGTPEANIRPARLSLAEVYASKGDLAAAENEINAINRSAQTNIYNCTLARFYLDKKQYDEAVEIAVSVNKNYRTCLFVLGESYLAKGYKVVARKYFEDYLKIISGLPAKGAFAARQEERVKKDLESIK